MKRNYKKSIVLVMLAALMTISSVVTKPVTVDAKTVHGLSDLGRLVADEGCVLIENRNNVLPFQKGTTVSIFGRSQCHYDKYKTGLGSGGDVWVDSKDLVNYIDGIRRNSKLNVNEELVNIYRNWVNEHPYNNGNNGWQGHPWSQEEMPMTKDIANAAKNKSDAAVIIISRTAGESRDSAFQKGGYLLTDQEENMIKIVSETFDKTVVLLNVTAIIDMSWVDKYNVDSVIYTWNGGQNGGDAVADVLSGDVNPSGRLADTIAKDYTLYPTYKNYGDKEKSYYQEDIYVGYRYFETFAPNDVKYPFGYGLSYTSFDIATNAVTEDGDYLKVSVSVTNTGNVAGKEVVQVYYGAPQAALGNPAKELAAFAKTELLEPGETENIALSFKISDMASYDDSGVTGHESCYVLEAGDYKIYIGNNVKDNNLAYTYNVPTLKVTETLSEAAAPYKDENFERFKAVVNGNKIKLETEKVPTLHTDIEKRIKDNLPKEYQSKNDGKRYKLIDVYNGKLTMEEFVGQMTNEEMAAMVIGNSQSSAANGLTNGCAGGFGGSVCMTNGQRTNLGDVYGIPLVGVADGPCGLRLQDRNTLLPCGNVIGCTWNPKLIEEMFELEGEELVLNEVDSLLGPGINIHRDPRCGRNFEYYSEDPLLTGMMAAATAQGVQKAGATVTAKHYACNNQESDYEFYESRRNTDAIVSERALREIYLKGFEIYVKSGCARSLMTSYNPVNGCWASTNYDLNTTILRNEWGYKGIVMTDWWGDLSNLPYADGTRNRHYTNASTMVKAQNDVFMKEDYTYGGQYPVNPKITNIMDKLNEGYLTRGELQRTAINICNFAMRSQRFATYNNIPFEPYFVEGEDWFKVEQAESGNPVVTGISVGGRKVSAFNQKVLEYKVYLPEGADIPEVTATADGGTELTIEQATQDKRIAVIRAKEQQAIKTYKITFTDEDNLTPVFADAELAEISNIFVNDKAIKGFDSNTYEYEVAVQSLNEAPVITCEKADNVKVATEFDSTGRIVTVKVVTKDQARSYKLKLGIAPQSDEFNDANLKNFWSIISENKNNWKLQDGHLTVGAEYGSIWQHQDHLKNQFVQSAYGDWIAEVKIDLPKLPSASYQSLGVIAMENQDNYIYVKMEYGNEGRVISLCQEKNGQMETIENLSKTDVERFTNVMYVRLKKLGNTYIASVSSDGNNYHTFATSVQADYDNPRFALVNGNGDVNLPEVLEARFDYVRFNQNVGDVVSVGGKTSIKVAEVAPVAVSAGLKPMECHDTDGGYCFTDSKEDEYVVYHINVEKEGIYDFNARMAAPVSDTQQVKFSASIDNTIVASFFTNGTGGAQSWINLNGGKARLSAGEHDLKILFNTSGINLNRIELSMVTDSENSEVIRVTCVGDSITDGVGASSGSMTYPAQLQRILGSQYTVTNVGVSGTTVLRTDANPYVNTDRYQQGLTSNPDVVIIMLGINDAVLSGITTQNRKDEFRRDYAALIESYMNCGSNPEILVALPTTCEDGWDNRNKNTGNVIIPIIKEVAVQYGLRVIDAHSFSSSWTRADYLADGLHPNDAGYTKLAGFFAEAITGKANKLEANKTYRIVSKLSGKALTIRDNSKDDLAELCQMPVANNDAQLWEVKDAGDGTYKLVNKNSGKALDVPGSTKEAGTTIIQWTEADVENQKWVIDTAGDGYWKVSPKITANFALNVNANSKEDGASIIQWGYNGAENELWAFEAVDGNTGSSSAIKTGTDYVITSKLSGKAMAMPNDSTENDTELCQMPVTKAASQTWTFEDAGDGYFYIINKNSGKALDVPGGSTEQGKAIIQYDRNNYDNQKWKVEATDDGYFRITPKVAESLALDVYANSQDDGAAIIQWEYSGAENQKWSLQEAGSTGGNTGNEGEDTGNEGENTGITNSKEYVITSKFNGKALAIANGSTENSAALCQMSVTNEPAQIWTLEDAGDGYYFIVNKNSGKALDVPGGSTEQGKGIIQYDRNNGDNQKWKVEATDDGYYRITPKVAENFALDIYGYAQDDGAAVVQWAYSGAENQKWSLQEAGSTGGNTGNEGEDTDNEGEDTGSTNSNDYVITVKFNGKALAVKDESRDDFAEICQTTVTHADSQVWTLEDAGDGYYFIINKNSGKALDVPRSTTEEGTAIIQWTKGNDDNQKWKVESTGDGYYRISPKIAEDLALDVSGFSTEDGAAIVQWTYNGGDNQKWKLESAK